jgi:hypothetical protein
LVGAARDVVDPCLLGPHPGFALEFGGGHEEVEERGQGRVDGDEEGLFLEPLETVVTDILTDDGAVFLLDEGGGNEVAESFLWWSRLLVKGTGWSGSLHHFSVALLMNSPPLSSATKFPLELPPGGGERVFDVR